VGVEPLRNGLEPGSTAVLVVVTGVMLIGAALVFERRELIS
jgi:hypothetical protein